MSVGIAFILAAVLSFFSIPTILNVVKEKRLYDVPNERKVTTHVIPTLGGIAIFLGFVVALAVASFQYPSEKFFYVITGLTVLLFVGLKDDLMDISPSNKFAGEFVAATIVCVLGKIRFTNLDGLLGIYQLNPWVSVLISLFFIAFLINAINLIDGIDGLASGLAISASLVMGSWFYMSGNMKEAIGSFALCGALCSFFIYNVFGHKNKLFMGDTGSLCVGMILSILIIRFNEINLSYQGWGRVLSAPAVSLGIVAVPVLDTLRVMILRMAHGHSPFKADQNHIHHKLLNLKFSHLQATLTLVGVNIAFTAIAFSFSAKMKINVLFGLLLVLGATSSLIPNWFLKKHRIVAPVKNKLSKEELQEMRSILEGASPNQKIHEPLPNKQYFKHKEVISK